MKKIILMMMLMSSAAFAQLKEPGLLMFEGGTGLKMSKEKIAQAIANDKKLFNLVQIMRVAARDKTVKTLSAEISRLVGKPIYLMTGNNKVCFWPAYNITNKPNPNWQEMNKGLDDLGLEDGALDTEEIIKLLKETKKTIIDKNRIKNINKRAAADFSNIAPELTNDI